MDAGNPLEGVAVDISDKDVLEAMKSIPGYIDITPADFRNVYRLAFAHAKDRMLNALKASDVMTAPVRTVGAGDDLVAAATLLAETGVSGAPVVDGDGVVVGVLSEKDFLRNMGAGQTGSFMRVVAHCLKVKGCMALPMKNRSVGDIMTSPAVTAPPDVTILEISKMLKDKKINRLPIVGSDGRPVGIVTRSDIVHSFHKIS